MSRSGAQSKPLDQRSSVAFGQVEEMSFDRALPRRDGHADTARGYGDFDAFVRARWSSLLRFGWALTGSDAAAADLVQDALERTLLSWSRMTGDPEGYVRRVMVTRNRTVEQITLVNPNEGYLIAVGGNAPRHLLTTTDTGHTWDPV